MNNVINKKKKISDNLNLRIKWIKNIQLKLAKK